MHYTAAHHRHAKVHTSCEEFGARSGYTEVEALMKMATFALRFVCLKSAKRCRSRAVHRWHMGAPGQLWHVLRMVLLMLLR